MSGKYPENSNKAGEKKNRNKNLFFFFFEKAGLVSKKKIGPGEFVEGGELAKAVSGKNGSLKRRRLEKAQA